MRSRGGSAAAASCWPAPMRPHSRSAGRFWRCRSWDWPTSSSIFAIALRANAGRRPYECSNNERRQISDRTEGDTAMEVILLERIAKLGQMGEVVRVKDGFARNFLLPKGKALRATKDNRAKFDGMKAQLEARNLEQKKDADVVAAKLNGKSFIVVRQASDVGQLFGSVSARDIAD